MKDSMKRVATDIELPKELVDGYRISCEMFRERGSHISNLIFSV